MPHCLLPYSLGPGVPEPWTEVLGLSAARVLCRLLGWTWALCEVAGHPSPSSTGATLFAAPVPVQGRSLWPSCTSAAASLTLGELRTGIETREGTSQVEQPLIRSARGQAMQNCRRRLRQEEIFSQCENAASHLSG